MGVKSKNTGRPPASGPASDPSRNAQLAKIHCEKKRLHLTDDLYRTIITRISSCNSSSAADLDSQERGRLLDEFSRLSARGPDSLAPRVEETEPQLRLIRLLWKDCALLSALRDPSERGLRAFVKRVAKVDSITWLTPGGATKVVEGLKAIRNRANRARAEEGLRR